MHTDFKMDGNAATVVVIVRADEHRQGARVRFLPLTRVFFSFSPVAVVVVVVFSVFGSVSCAPTPGEPEHKALLKKKS